MRAKDKVLSRMQRFKRATPPRLVHTEEKESVESAVQPAEIQSLPTQGPVDKQESDEVLAQRLHQQLARETQNQALVDVEDGGLFFCQLCYKDLSAMSHQLRTQHINRCLDERENSTSRVPVPVPAPAPARPRIPECPICGRGFKSEKTRSTHLKRCSVSMGVSPAELLQALQRQAAEREKVQQAGGSSDTSESSMPVRKKARKKAPCMDEDTMVALALSRSLLEQEKERERDREEERRIQAQLSSITAPVVQGAGKGRVKRRKGAPPGPPPLLLVQDPQAAQNRIQERVSSLLLMPRPPTPPTPTLKPSVLSTHTLLWLKSALPGGGPVSLSEFYTTELGEFIQPWIREEKKSPLSEVTPVKQCPAAAATESIRPPEQNLADSASRCPSTPGLGTPGTQALTDLVELAEEGMTLTQYRYTDTDPAVAKPLVSGFVAEPTETQRPPINPTIVSRLCSDLGSMVNNPQLSDVQLQVDSGDVYFAHSFMLYTRCPLLANMVHDAGFGVQEEGFPQAQRVLLNDVSGEAVYTMLQYLYTAVCHLTHTLLPDVLQLARRFGLSELQEQCEQYTGNSSADPREQEWDMAHESAAERQQSLADTQFLELLRSMWEHEEVDGEAVGEAKRGSEDEHEEGSGDGENKDDVVDEDELNEIYEFVATQRKMGAKVDVSTESDHEEEEEDEGVKNCSDTEQRDEVKQNVKMEKATGMHRSTDVDLNPGSNKNVRQSRGPDTSIDQSYNRMFSESWGEYVEPSQRQTHHLHQKNTPTSRRTSSVSEVIDLSISPPPESPEPARSLFPVAGESPGDTPDQSEAVKQALISGSLNAHGISQLTAEHPSTSALSKTKNELTSLPSITKPNLSRPTPSISQPELIVLSDSSDDTDHVHPDEVPSHDDTPRLPTSSPSRLSLRYTHIKAKENIQVGLSPKRSNKSPNSVHSEPSRSDKAGSDVLDGSAEVSWLIPATPVPSTRTNSTQTSSSMRRTQLFPRSHSSSSSSFSSSISDNCKTTSHSDSLKDPYKELRLTSHSRLSKTSHSDSVNRTYPNSASEPCSSTPLHSDPRLQRLDSLGSPLLRDSELRNQRRTGQEGTLGSLPISLSESSSSPQRSSQSEKESRKSPAKSQYCGDTEDQEMSTEEKQPGETRTSKTNEVGVIEEGHSFAYDEPPIAFDDSWGLGGAVAEQGPCFSLRLESSGDHTSPPEQSGQGGTASLHTFSPPGHGAPDLGAPHNHSLPDAEMWDSWKEDDEHEEEVDALPLSQRVGPVALAKRVSQLRTPVVCKKKNQAPLVPITPMPSFSDMDTPELKNKLNRYGVRPLPKKQMVLKLKEIHQYTHQLMSSGSEEETSPQNRPRAIPATFKQPTVPPTVSPRKLQFGEEEEEQDALPASQDSNTSSTAESERSNPELCDSEDDGSDSEGITASQAAVREKDKLQAVHSFILCDPVLYGRVLQYQPLSLCDLKAGLRTAGIRLGTAKLLDFLDSQCITFTTAKQGHPAPSHRRVRRAGRGRKRLGKAAE